VREETNTDAERKMQTSMGGRGWRWKREVNSDHKEKNESK